MSYLEGNNAQFGILLHIYFKTMMTPNSFEISSFNVL